MDVWVLFVFLCLNDSPCKPVNNKTVGIPGWQYFYNEEQCLDDRDHRIEFQQWRKDNGMRDDLFVGDCRKIGEPDAPAAPR